MFGIRSAGTRGCRAVGNGRSGIGSVHGRDGDPPDRTGPALTADPTRNMVPIDRRHRWCQTAARRSWIDCAPTGSSQGLLRVREGQTGRPTATQVHGPKAEVRTGECGADPPRPVSQGSSPSEFVSHSVSARNNSVIFENQTQSQGSTRVVWSRDGRFAWTSGPRV
jgi:hypothetical protein